jgi:hypothetical protein
MHVWTAFPSNPFPMWWDLRHSGAWQEDQGRLSFWVAYLFETTLLVDIMANSTRDLMRHSMLIWAA